MSQQKALSSDTDITSTEASLRAAEMDALRKRLAALEESVSGDRANAPRAGKVNPRIIMIGLVLVTLTIVWMVSERASIVHSQSSVTDALTIDKNGNVGIGTTTPSVTLDVNGNFKARTAEIIDQKLGILRFRDGTDQVSAAPPAGAVIAFNLAACPAGWGEFAPARGRFIRGIDRSGQNIDPDGQRSPGGTQEDAIRNITGSITGVKGAGNRAWDWGFRPGTSGAFDVPYNLGKYNPYGGGEYDPTGGVGFSANFDASRVVPTASENRPKNVALLYCQKN